MDHRTPRYEEERLCIEEMNDANVFTLFKIDRARRRWRLLAIFVVLMIIILTTLNIKVEEKESDRIPRRDFIAKIKISGIILDDSYRLKRINKLKNAENVKAVILEIDSPGGSMVPGLELMEELQALGNEKPLVVRMKSVAASAGFLISLPAEYVVANQASITGSVGVLMPLIDATEMGNKLGIKSAEITSGDFKDVTSPLITRTPEATAFLQSTVNELQGIFMDKVTQRRNITPEVKEIISDGRFFIGETALKYKLIDELGGSQTVLNYLYEQKQLDKNLDVVEVSLVKKKKYKWQEVFADELTDSLIKNLKTSLQSINLTPQAM